MIRNSLNPGFWFTQQNKVTQHQYSNNDGNVSGMSLLLRFLFVTSYWINCICLFFSLITKRVHQILWIWWQYTSIWSFLCMTVRCSWQPTARLAEENTHPVLHIWMKFCEPPFHGLSNHHQKSAAKKAWKGCRCGRFMRLNLQRLEWAPEHPYKYDWPLFVASLHKIHSEPRKGA